MEFFCPRNNANPLNPTNLTNSSGTSNAEAAAYEISTQITTTTSGSIPQPNEEDPWDYTDFARKIAVPALCSCGIVGNILNILILSTRIREGVDTMERGALAGMMALAVSDFLFCLVTFSGTYLPEEFIFYQKNFVFYYTVYGNFLQNTLIKTSTWFTVILAVSRYLAVSNPIKARQYMRCVHTVIAILICAVVWILLHIPLTYMWEVIEISCPVPTIYILISGVFVKNNTLNSVFTYIWGILGFIVPIILLVYCNLKLIHSLHLSRNLRKRRLEGQRKCAENTSQKFITITLISIVFMFFALVLPSEIVYFYGEIAKPKFSETYRMFFVTSNLLQAINFSMNFVLYCFVNQYFRKTIKRWGSKLPFFGMVQSPTRTRLSLKTSSSFRSSVSSKQITFLTKSIH